MVILRMFTILWKRYGLDTFAYWSKIQSAAEADGNIYFFPSNLSQNKVFGKLNFDQMTAPYEQSGYCHQPPSVRPSRLEKRRNVLLPPKYVNMCLAQKLCVFGCQSTCGKLMFLRWFVSIHFDFSNYHIGFPWDPLIQMRIQATAVIHCIFSKIQASY